MVADQRQEYIQPVMKGLKEAMDRGVLAGFPVVDISVDLYDGSYHDVDSSEIRSLSDVTHLKGKILERQGATAIVNRTVMRN